MVSTRTTEPFYKYDIIPKEQHAFLIGRGSTTPIMQMNAAMEHTWDNTRNPKPCDLVRYKRDPDKPWITARVEKIHKNGNHTLTCHDTMKQERGIPRHKIKLPGKPEKYLHLLLTNLAACYDCIPYTIIQLCVTRIGLPPQFLRLIRGMQEQQHRSLQVNGQPPTPHFYSREISRRVAVSHVYY